MTPHKKNYFRQIPRSLWFTLYDGLLPIAELILRVLSIRNKKLRDAIKGRSKSLDNWQLDPLDDRRGILIHAASYGELEGVKPLINQLAKRGFRVAVSHSSPSAIKGLEGIEGLWGYGYSPMDYLHQHLNLLAHLDINALVITKHDYWPNMLRAACALGIPIFLINGNFHRKSLRGLPIIRSFSRQYMRFFDVVWTVSEEDSDRADKFLPSSVKLENLGDTRYDRVRERAEIGKIRFADLKRAMGDSRILIGGSTWDLCEKMIYPTFKRLRDLDDELKLVMVPHEPHPETIQRNINFAKSLDLSAKLFSNWQGETITENVLLVDKVGILADLYSVGWAAYVGGGFGRGVHSVIEPAAHSLPVAFAKNWYVSYEAGLLIEAKGGFVVNTEDELYSLWSKMIKDDTFYTQSSSTADGVVRANEGTTTKIVEKLLAYLDPQ